MQQQEQRRQRCAPIVSAAFGASGSACNALQHHLHSSRCSSSYLYSGTIACSSTSLRQTTTSSSLRHTPTSSSTRGRRRAATRAAAAAQPPPAQPSAARPPPMTIAVTGATGLIGSRLTAKLASQGNRVRVLTRDVAAARGKLPYPAVTFFGPAEWEQGVLGADGVVNLAGTPIGTRWTPEIKQQIKSSRLETTARVAAAISAAPEGQRPRVFVSSSAVGFYGSSSVRGRLLSLAGSF